MSSWQHHSVNAGYLFLREDDVGDPGRFGGMWVIISTTKAGREGMGLFLVGTPAGEAS